MEADELSPMSSERRSSALWRMAVSGVEER